MRGEAWTDEQDAQLRKMRERGFSSTQIAAEIGTTRNAVIGRAMRLGLDKRRAGTRGPRKKKLSIVNHGNYFKASAVPSAPSIPAIDNQSDAPIALLDLQPHHCRWPVRDSPSYLFCAGTKTDGSSYCSRHFSISRRGVSHD